MNPCPLDKDIEDAVYSEIEDLIHRPRNTFKLSDHLVLDLKIDSDDLSFLFVPDLEKAFEIKIPVREWDNIATGEDTVKLIKGYLHNSKILKFPLVRSPFIQGYHQSDRSYCQWLRLLLERSHISIFYKFKIEVAIEINCPILGYY